MQRRVFLLLGLLLAMSTAAQAATLSLQGTGILQPGLTNQTITLVLGGGDTYTDSNLRGVISAGGPLVTLSNGSGPGTATPAANLLPTIWSGGASGVGPLGLTQTISFNTNGFAPQNTSGIYAVFTLNTVGVNPGTYTLDLSASDLINGLNEELDPNFVQLSTSPITLTVVPEPSSIVMGLFAAAGMAAVVIRRRRAA